jgi:hypothetical protein
MAKWQVRVLPSEIRDILIADNPAWWGECGVPNTIFASDEATAKLIGRIIEDSGYTTDMFYTLDETTKAPVVEDEVMEKYLIEMSKRSLSVMRRAWMKLRNK